MVRLACVLALVFGCGGEPVGAKLPRPNPTDVAIAAAAAAAVTSLANPKATGRTPEKNEDPRELRDPTGPRERVPADVLDRADDGDDGDAGPDSNRSDAGPAAPCPPRSDAPPSALDFGQRADCGDRN